MKLKRRFYRKLLSILKCFSANTKWDFSLQFFFCSIEHFQRIIKTFSSTWKFYLNRNSILLDFNCLSETQTKIIPFDFSFCFHFITPLWIVVQKKKELIESVLNKGGSSHTQPWKNSFYFSMLKYPIKLRGKRHVLVKRRFFF